MNLPKIALTLFLVSFALPAWENGNGYQCAMACVSCVSEGVSFALYYFPFTFSNLAMLVLPVMLMTRWKRRPVPTGVIVAQVVLLLHVLSWPTLALADGEIAAIGVGFYVWLASMVMMLVASLRSTRSIAVPSLAHSCC